MAYSHIFTLPINTNQTSYDRIYLSQSYLGWACRHIYTNNVVVILKKVEHTIGGWCKYKLRRRGWYSSHCQLLTTDRFSGRYRRSLNNRVNNNQYLCLLMMVSHSLQNAYDIMTMLWSVVDKYFGETNSKIIVYLVFARYLHTGHYLGWSWPAGVRRRLILSKFRNFGKISQDCFLACKFTTDYVRTGSADCFQLMTGQDYTEQRGSLHDSWHDTNYLYRRACELATLATTRNRATYSSAEIQEGCLY